MSISLTLLKLKRAKPQRPKAAIVNLPSNTYVLEYVI